METDSPGKKILSIFFKVLKFKDHDRLFFISTNITNFV